MFFFLSLFFISGLTQRWWEHWSWFSSQNCYETTHYQKKFLFDNSHWPLRLYKCSIVRALVQLGCVPPNSLLDWEDCKFLVIGDCNRTCRRPVAVTEKMSMLSCVCGYTEKKKNEFVRLGTVYWDRQNYSAGHQSILKLSLPGHTFIIQSLINNILPDFMFACSIINPFWSEYLKWSENFVLVHLNHKSRRKIIEKFLLGGFWLQGIWRPFFCVPPKTSPKAAGSKNRARRPYLPAA